MNKKYWLIGGIFFTLIYALLVIRAIPDTVYDLDELIMALRFLQYPVTVIESILGVTWFEIPNLIIGGVISWFAMGTLFGWIYGKIKNRKRKQAGMTMK